MIEQDGSDSFKVVKLAKRPQQQGVKLVMPEIKPEVVKHDLLPPEWFDDDWPTVGSDLVPPVNEAPSVSDLWNKFWGKLWDEVDKAAILEERKLQTERIRNQEATRLLLLALEASRDPKN